MTKPTGTVLFSLATIFRSRPDAGDSYSNFALSVMISTSGSPASMRSPSRFSQRPIMPSMMFASNFGNTSFVTKIVIL